MVRTYATRISGQCKYILYVHEIHKSQLPLGKVTHTVIVAACNSNTHTVTVAAWDWTVGPSPEAARWLERGHVDLVVAGDVVYADELVGPLVRALCEACSPRSKASSKSSLA
jgi:hypothetical protein